MIDPDRLVYKPCGEERNLTVSTELRVATSDKTRMNALDMNSDLGSTYTFAWRTCP